MSSFINKARDKIEATLERSSNKGDNQRSDNYGPHGSNVSNTVNPSVHSDLDGRNNPTGRVGGYGNTQAYDQHHTSQGAGGHASSDTYGSSTNNPAYNNPQSTNAGPHSSNLMNKFDPRVDSDRDNRNDPTSRAGGYGNTQEYSDIHGQAGGAGGLSTTQTSSMGHGLGHGAGTTAHTATTGYTGTSSTHDNPASSNAGPHRSEFANKLDPRYDSDRDHRNDPTSRVGGYDPQAETTTGYGSGQTSSYGIGANTGYASEPATGYGSTTTGEYSTGTTGKYGSGMTTSGVGGYEDSSYTPGSGNATGTAGPHNSNILNKLDPRVDSDMDGSKTYGGNQTHR